MLDQRRRRWADVVQMLYKSFVFAGMFVQTWNECQQQQGDFSVLGQRLATFAQRWADALYWLSIGLYRY